MNCTFVSSFLFCLRFQLAKVTSCRKFTYNEILASDKTSLDITWIKDKSLVDLDNLPDPNGLAAEIVENLEAGLESFKAVIESLKK